MLKIGKETGALLCIKNLLCSSTPINSNQSEDIRNQVTKDFRSGKNARSGLS